MAGLPFFTLAPIETSTPQATPLSPKPLAETPSNGPSMGPVSNTGASEGNADGNSGFFQALQEQMLPSDEQTLAAFLPIEGDGQAIEEIVSLDADQLVDFDELDLASIEVVDAVEVDAERAGEPIDGLYLPVAAPIDAQQPDAEVLEIAAQPDTLQHIEAQRSAQPQTNMINTVSPSLNETHESLTAESALPAAGIANAGLANSKIMPAAQSSTDSGIRLMPEDGWEVLDEHTELDAKVLAQAMHEKPMTLADSQDVNKAGAASLVDLAVSSDGEGPDLDAMSGLLGQRDQQAALKTNAGVTNAASVAEKLPDIESKLPVPPSHPQWNEQVAKRIGIMVNEQVQQAKIQLDPPELGLLEVKVRVQHDQVHVAISSAHQVVRDALEAQSPRLRDLLEQQGVQLGQMDVSDHGQSQDQREHSDGSAEGVAGSWGEDSEFETAWVATEKTSSVEGAVDYFA